MADEKDEKYENIEEVEYHFSDEQLDYDIDPDLPKTPSDTVTATAPKSKVNILEKLSHNRRALIVTSLLLSLIFIIYKMLMPTAAPPPADFAQNETPAAAPPVSQQAAVQQPAPVAPAAAITPPPPPAAMPASAPIAQNQEPLVAPLPVQQPSQTAGFAPAPQVSVTTAAAPAAQQPAPATIQSTMPPPVDSTMPVESSKNVLDRIAALEQQNAKLAALMQTQYAQKVVDYEAQNNEMQQKINTLTRRMANVQLTLNQLAQMIQSSGQMVPATMAAPLPKTTESKLTFAVQAIIPGRAWLKSDAGDTVTVAEGDILKGYGRITKIDPYDGVVDIDTGSKVITLTYGMNGDL